MKQNRKIWFDVLIISLFFLTGCSSKYEDITVKFNDKEVKINSVEIENNSVVVDANLSEIMKELEVNDSVIPIEPDEWTGDVVDKILVKSFLNEIQEDIRNSMDNEMGGAVSGGGNIGDLYSDAYFSGAIDECPPILKECESCRRVKSKGILTIHINDDLICCEVCSD